MKFLSKIPRGLIIFLGGIALVIMLIVGYRAFFTGNTSGTNGGVINSIFSSIFPFGNPSTAGNAGDTGTSPPLTTPEQSGTVPLLRQVSADPVSGGWFAGASSTTPPIIRFMDRQSGHIEETPADSFARTRISNTTLPGMQELYAVGDLTVIVRTLDENGDIENLLGAINATSSQQTLTTAPTRAFDEIALAGGGNILTITKSTSGSRVDLSKPDGTKTQTLFNSPITSWVPLAAGSRNFLETAPTATAPGYLYELKNQGKGIGLSKIVGGLPGFTSTVSPSGRYVAFSGNTRSGFAFSILDTKTGATQLSPIHALALKCAWVPNLETLIFCAVPQNPDQASYPDDWLIGNTFFSDQAWVIDTSKNTAYFIGNLADQNGTALDAERILIDSSGSYALFINKKDLSLWSLNIAGVVARAKGK